MKKFLFLLISYALVSNNSNSQHLPEHDLLTSAPNAAINYLTVLQTQDFAVTGKGDNYNWEKAKWNNLSKLDTGGKNYGSKFKILYSTKGTYVLFTGEDDKITTRNYNDFEAIYNGDVFEVFFLPNPKTPVYFEYEINQLSKELILTLSKTNNQLYSWSPRYPTAEDQKPIKKQVAVTGGKVELDGVIKNWTAEIYFPYTILGLLPNVPPASGSFWNANFCRLDYDSGTMTK